MTQSTTYADLWFGVRNYLYTKLGVTAGAKLTKPDGETIPHPGNVLVPQNVRFSDRHAFGSRVQFVDAKLWYQFWRLSFLQRHCRSKLMPHQGTKERNRRRNK